MNNIKSFNEWLNEKKKPAGAPEWKDSDAPDAEGRFRDLSIKDLAAWLIKTRKKDVKKISGSLTQQIVFNRNDDPEYAEKMEKTRKEVYRQLGREDLLDEKESPYKKETLLKYKKEYEEGKEIPFGIKTSLIAQGMIPHEGGPDKGKKKKTELYEAQMGILDTQVEINSVNYGNPPLEYIEIMQKPDDYIKNWFIENGLTEKFKQEAPLNNSEITQSDLQILVDKTTKATAEEITFARFVDDPSNIAQMFIDILKEHDVEITMGDFFRIDSQSEGILHFLKDIINRPRPYQLAKYYNYPIYPLIRTDAMSASYPSGHALLGFMTSEYYTRKYPQVGDKLLELGKKIANSRELTGIHYPSDTQVSREICDIIIKNNLIQE
jgi:hypothetical protein